MCYKTEIDQYFVDGKDVYGHFDTRKVLDQCTEFFEKLMAAGEELDPRPIESLPDGKANELNRGFVYAARKFIEYKYPYAAIDLLLRGWQRLNQIQAETSG